jgi:hypothetical protein
MGGGASGPAGEDMQKKMFESLDMMKQKIVEVNN